MSESAGTERRMISLDETNTFPKGTVFLIETRNSTYRAEALGKGTYSLTRPSKDMGMRVGSFRIDMQIGGSAVFVDDIGPGNEDGNRCVQTSAISRLVLTPAAR